MPNAHRTERHTANTGAAHNGSERPSNATPVEANWLALGTESISVLSSFGQLALLELALALKGMPKLLWSAIFSAFFVVCFWLSASATLAWWLSDWMNTPLAGLLGFTALQLSGLVICQLVKRHLLHRLTLPETRRQWQHLKSAFDAPCADTIAK